MNWSNKKTCLNSTEKPAFLCSCLGAGRDLGHYSILISQRENREPERQSELLMVAELLRVAELLHSRGGKKQWVPWPPADEFSCNHFTLPFFFFFSTEENKTQQTWAEERSCTKFVTSTILTKSQAGLGKCPEERLCPWSWLRTHLT